MSGLGRAWVRKNVEKAKRILSEIPDLTPQERDYLKLIIEEGEAFLRLTTEGYTKLP